MFLIIMYITQGYDNVWCIMSLYW